MRTGPQRHRGRRRAIACVAPFLGGAANIMQWVIIGIGLYQAWHINRRPVYKVTGPLRLNVEAPLATPDGG
ncbi:MAG: hypothetical protein HYU66_14665 [Armatimonadetes bacterium]|nr:hypothetical protein [Armatimonadota bacterium]